ncbi:hypothetical protein [Desulfobulbus propionicus]
MKYWRHLLLCALTVVLCSCGTTVKESLKVQPAQKKIVGNDQTVVILPFADYSYADNLESAYRRNLFVNESIIDQFVRLGFHLPVQEDIFLYLADQNIITVASYNPEKTKSIEYELNKEWSPAMKQTLQNYIDYAQRTGLKGKEGDDALTHGLTQQEIVKIGRHFSADYIVRGRIIQYKDRLDPSGALWKKGVIPFFVGGTKDILLGQAIPGQYDNLGAFDADRESILVFGDVPQAVVQLRIWVQDAYTGNIVWTNRANVQVSPESFFADYQYDALFETATEKAVTKLMNDFAYTVYNVPLPVEKKTRR